VKTAVLTVLAFILGGTVFYVYSQINTPKLTKTQTPTLSQVKPTAKVTDQNIPPIKANNKLGKVSGRLSYPSEMIPELLVVAFNSQDDSEFYYFKTDLNQTNYEIELPEGTYYLVSYVLDEEGSYGGGYTNAVSCGLSVECENHDLVEIDVEKTSVLTNIDLTDWYAPENTFPLKPDVQ